MNSYLRKLDLNMQDLEYNMYQDIPKEEMGSLNPIFGLSIKEYQDKLKQFIESETTIDPGLNSTTNRYIYYVNDYPVGEIAIRTTLNDFWINDGSQIFYKIRLSERQKGYGTKMLALALLECKKLGFKEIHLNCNDRNEGSKKVIYNNGGKFLHNYGESSRYVINLGDVKENK